MRNKNNIKIIEDKSKENKIKRSNCKIIKDKIFSIIGTLIVRARGYYYRPPASKLKLLTPPPLIPSQKTFSIKSKKILR